MNRTQRSRPTQRRKPLPKRPSAVDVWRVPAPLPEVEPVVVASDPGLLLRSLGDPPVHGGVGGGTAAGHYFDAVVQRAAAIALALAVSADLLATGDQA